MPLFEGKHHLNVLFPSVTVPISNRPHLFLFAMARLGGNSQTSHLLDHDMNASTTRTVTMSSSDRASFGGVYVHHQSSRGHSASPPESGARSLSLGSAVGSPADHYSTPSDGRSRTYSTPTLRRTSDTSNHSEGSLRRRSRLADHNSYELPVLSRSTSSPTSSPAYMMQASPCLRRTSSSSSTASPPRRLGHLVQCIVIFIIFGLVWDSHCKVEQATEQLLRYQQEESHLIEKMSTVENRATELREKIRAIKDEEAQAEADSVEPALKTLRLQQELAHLQHEDELITEQLETLQKRIQKSARESIVKMYGEGTLRVDLQLNFNDGGPGVVSLELSDETPHAAWVWLQQLIRHDWDDSMFRWRLAHVILATPARMSSQNYKLEFIERNEELNHEKYSIGLSQREDGGINFYINLLDNGPYHEGDVCIGKVVGGFGALNKLVSVPVHEETNHLDPAVSIRKATVKVLPNKQKQQQDATEKVVS